MAKKYVDLSVRIDDKTYGPPSTNVRVSLVPNYRPPSKPGVKFDYWVATTVTMSVHTGSHMDVPSHNTKEGFSTDSLKVEDFVSSAVVARLKGIDKNHGVTIEDIENSGVKFEKGEVIILNTNWTDKTWGKFPDYYVESPFLTVEAAEYLVSKKPHAVGFDFFPEYSARLKDFKSDDFVIHHMLLDHGVLMYQQMANLSKVPDRFKIFAGIPKIGGIDGAPARFIGEFDSP